MVGDADPLHFTLSLSKEWGFFYFGLRVDSLVDPLSCLYAMHFCSSFTVFCCLSWLFLVLPFTSHVISYQSSVVWLLGGPKAACVGCAGFAAFSVVIEKFLDRHDWFSAVPAPILQALVIERRDSSFTISRYLILNLTWFEIIPLRKECFINNSSLMFLYYLCICFMIVK